MATVEMRATIDDLYKVEGKAELIGGRIVESPMNGLRPGNIAFNITVSLKTYAKQTGRGLGTPDNVGFRVPELSSGRESFGPDSAYYEGPPLQNEMRFIPGAPTFAAEVRSENDYGDAADEEYAEKRSDYFEAGTKCVWDVDPIAETVTRYASPTDVGTVFHRGETADAEPAVPGWRVALVEVFERD